MEPYEVFDASTEDLVRWHEYWTHGVCHCMLAQVPGLTD